jgi:zinc transporter, ZIP family
LSLLALTGYAFLTALATGLGALPFVFTRRVSARWAAVAGGVAGLLMMGTSAGLLAEGFRYGAGATVLGALLVYGSHAWTAGRGDVAVWHLRGADARRALVVFGVMFAHSFTEGIGLGVAFEAGTGLGALVTATMALHNVPEGLAISLALVPRGTPVWQAALLSVVSSLPQPLMAVPAYLFVDTFRALLPAGLGFAAGAMLWLAATDLLPEAVRGWRRTAAPFGS